MAYVITNDKILRINNTYLLKSCIVGIKYYQTPCSLSITLEVLHSHIHNNDETRPNFNSNNRLYFNTIEELDKAVDDILSWLTS